jgi:hypothetical protein
MIVKIKTSELSLLLLLLSSYSGCSYQLDRGENGLCIWKLGSRMQGRNNHNDDNYYENHYYSNLIIIIVVKTMQFRELLRLS